MNNMKKYRIKHYFDENLGVEVFMPQEKAWIGWKGLVYVDEYTWRDSQSFLSTRTEESARQLIQHVHEHFLADLAKKVKIEEIKMKTRTTYIAVDL